MSVWISKVAGVRMKIILPLATTNCNPSNYAVSEVDQHSHKERTIASLYTSRDQQLKGVGSYVYPKRLVTRETRHLNVIPYTMAEAMISMRTPAAMQE